MDDARPTDDPALPSDDETFVPHVGWLEHDAGDDVATYLRQGWFEYAEQAFAWLYLRPGDIVVDCGSHVGLFAVLASRVTGPAGRVLAIEPHPATVDRLRRNLDRNGASGATVHAVAVSSREGSTTLHAGRGATSAYSSLVLPIEKATPVTVRTLPLDDLLEHDRVGDVAFLKIDVEGAELDVLEGAVSLIDSTRLGVAMVEFTEGNLTGAGRTSVELAEAWTRHGYGWYQLDETSLQLVPVAIERPVEYANYFATRDVTPVNERLRTAPPEHRRCAKDILCRGRTAFALLKRACDGEHFHAWWKREHQVLLEQHNELHHRWNMTDRELRALKDRFREEPDAKRAPMDEG